jgi:RNA polymerase sigma-70 factor, ECF subfamily
MKAEFSENKLPENFFLEELSKDNTRVFDKIFNDYYPNLCRLAFHIVRDEDMAQSLVQDVFIKFWEGRKSMVHIDNLAAFLTIMVRNHCLNNIKREKRHVILAQIPPDIRIDNVTEKQLQAYEFEEKLFIELSALPERCKMGFEYSRFDNLNNKEIAVKMGISVKAVEALIGRALKSLRVSLAEFLPSSKIEKE